MSPEKNTSGLDHSGIAHNFIRANETLTRLSEIPGYLKKSESKDKQQWQDTGDLYLVALVHPELRDEPLISSLVNTQFSGSTAARTRLPQHMLKAYMPAVIPPNPMANPLVRLVEDYRTGIIDNISEGQRMGEGRDLDTSNYAASRFEEQADRLIEYIDSLDHETGDYSLSTETILRKKGIDPDTLPGYRADSVFGYTDGDADGILVHVKPETMDYLRTLERWFYYAMTNPGSVAVKAGGDSYLDLAKDMFGKLAALSGDPSVKALVNSLNEIYGRATVGGRDLGISSRASSFGQMLAFIFGNVSTSKTLIDDCIEKGLLDRDAAYDAYAKISDARSEVNSSTEIDVSKYNAKDLERAVKGLSGDSEASDAALELQSKLSKGLVMSPALASLKAAGILKDKPARTAMVLGTVLDNPAYTELFGASVTDNSADADTGSKMDLASRKAEQAHAEMGAIQPPFDTARESLRKLGSDSAETSGTTMYRIDDDGSTDVTGAHILPRMQVPLFTKTLKVPTSTIKLEAKLLKEGTLLAVYSILSMADPQFGSGNSPVTLSRAEPESGEGEASQVLTFETTSDIDFDPLFLEVNEYFAKLAVNPEPAVAVNTRNDWVDIITSDEKWDTIAEELYSYMLLQCDRAENSGHAASADAADIKDNLYADIEKLRKHVMRNVFEVRERCRDYQVTDTLTVRQASPLSPYNLERNGRLRLTGGENETVTAVGDRIIEATDGKVDRVNDVNGHHRYTVTLNLSRDKVSETVDDTSRENWIPSGLVDSINTGRENAIYALWVGLEFCSSPFEEGNENTLRYNEDIIAAGNDAMRGTLHNTATPDHVAAMAGTDTSLADMYGYIPTLSGSTIQSLRTGLNSLAACADDAEQVIRAVKVGGLFARALDVRYSKAMNKATYARRDYDNSVELGDFASAPGAAKAADQLVKNINSTILAYWSFDLGGQPGGSVFDTTNLDGMSRIIGFCNAAKDPASATARLKSAIAGLVSPVEEKPGLVCLNVPFSVTEDDTADRVSVSPVPEKETEYTSSLFDTQCDTLGYLNTELSGMEGPLSENDIATCMSSLAALRKAYLDGCTYQIEQLGRGSRSAATRALAEKTSAIMDEVNSDEFAAKAARVGATLARGTSGDPEASRLPLVSVFNTVGNVGSAVNPADEKISNLAANIDTLESLPIRSSIERGDTVISRAGDEIAAFRKPVPGAETYNARYGKGQDTLPLTGQDLPVDDRGELDDRSGDSIHSSIDFGRIDRMDTDEMADFSDVCSGRTMLGMVKSDPVGMYSETGTADVGAGINPSEFETLVKALDAAHDELVNHRSASYGSAESTATRLYMNYKSYALDQAIDSFRLFFASRKPLGNRNVLSEAGDVLDLFKKVVDSCQDPSIEDALGEDLKSVSDVVRKASMASEDAGPYGNVQAARAISTGFANVVLHLASLKNNVAVQDPDDVDLSRHGSRAIGREGYGDADTFMGATAYKPYESGDHAYKRSKGEVAEKNDRSLMASTQEWLADCPELTRALITLYQGIGLEQTANPEGALNPFTNISDKAKTKSNMAYRNLYSGVAGSQLCSALVFAIAADESNPGEGYPTVAGMLRGLLGRDSGTQTPVNVPAYVFRGSDAVANPEILSVCFDEDGNAVPASEGAAPAFTSMREVYSAAGLANYGTGTGDPLKDIVTAVREHVMEAQLNADSKTIVNTALNLSKNFDEGGHDDVLERFSSTMMDAARRIKGSPDGFIPLSVLYLCTDNNVVNMAYSIELERAHRNRVDAQDRAMAGRIMRDTFDPAELPVADDVAKNIERNRSLIAEKTAEIVSVLSDGEDPGEGFPYVMADSPCSDGSTLSDIMGEDLAVNYVNQVVESYRESGKADTTLQTPGDALRSVAETLASYGNGGIGRDDAVSAIVSVFGPRSAGMAGKLVDRFDGELGKAGIDGDIPLGTLKHIAARTVMGEFQKSGDFTNMLGEKYRTRGLEDIRATRLTRGAATTPYINKVDGESGADVLFSKTEAALLAISAPDGDPDGKADEFLTRDIRYKEKPDDFVKAFEELWNALVTLGNASAEGMGAALGIRNAPQNPTPAQARRQASYHGKVDSLRCGGLADENEGPLTREGAGKSRQWAIDVLEDAVKSIVTGVTRRKEDAKKALISHGLLDTARCPQSLAPLFDEINRMARERFVWSPNDDTDTLSEGIASNRDDSVLDADREKVRRLVAHAYAYSPSTYQSDVVPDVNAASKFRGVGEKDSLTRSEAENILSALADIPDSPVKRVNSDMYDDEYRYRINGAPVTDDEAFVIVNSAMNMYDRRMPDSDATASAPAIGGGKSTRPAKLTAGGVDSTAMLGKSTEERLKSALAGYDGDGGEDKASGSPSIDDHAFVDDFAECVRLCASLKKDYPFSTENITKLTLSTLKRMNLLKAGPIPDTVEFRYRVNKKVEGTGSTLNQWFVFDVPVSTVTGTIESKLDASTNSANEWSACAAEIERMRNRNRDVRAHNATLSPEVRNRLGVLVNDVRKALADRCAAAVAGLDGETLGELLHATEPVDIGGIYARPSRVAEETDPSTDITAGEETVRENGTTRRMVPVEDSDLGTGNRRDGEWWAGDEDATEPQEPQEPEE